MEKTKIETITRNTVICYVEKPIINFWFYENLNQDNSNNKNVVIEFLDNANEMICIHTSKFDDKTIIESLLNQLSNKFNLRVYILLNEYSDELNILNNKTLIRYGVETNGTYITIDNYVGLFFTGNITENDFINNDHILININEDEKLKKIQRHFCYNFWEIAKKEKINNTHKNIENKPFDILHDTNEYNGKDFVYGTLFKFIPEKKRKEFKINTKIIFCGKEKNGPLKIKYNSDIKLDDIKLDYLPNKEEFDKIEPNNLIDDYLSWKITYNYNIIPFYLPENAKKHSLYKKWEEEEKKISDFINKIINKIEEIEKKDKTLSDKIKRFFLGKITKLKSYKIELEEIKKVKLSYLSSKDLKDKIKRINDILKELEVDLKEIDKEEKSARIDEEIENLENSKKEKEKILNEKKKELENKNYNYNEKKTNEFEIFIEKIQSEIENIEKDIKNINMKIEQLKKEKFSHSDNKNKSSPLEDIFINKSNKNKDINLLEVSELPPLPEIGILYEFDNVSYLAIEYWEEYEKGELDAKRLNAKLCALK